MKTSTLCKRFLPYYRPYFLVLIKDLCCAALITVCEMVLPLIIRYITNAGMQSRWSMSMGIFPLRMYPLSIRMITMKSSEI